MVRIDTCQLTNIFDNRHNIRSLTKWRKRCRKKKEKKIHTAGPPCVTDLQLFTFLIKPSRAAGSAGTPKSGHAMKWNCLTIRSIACPVRVTWNVRTTWSGNSWMSVMVMRMSLRAMLPLSGQYWAHLTRPFSSKRVSWKKNYNHNNEI